MGLVLSMARLGATFETFYPGLLTRGLVGGCSFRGLVGWAERPGSVRSRLAPAAAALGPVPATGGVAGWISALARYNRPHRQ